MSDITCPYCKHEYDHHGDFEGMSINNELQEHCPNCDKSFKLYVEFYPHFSDGYKVACWNGEPCDYKIEIRDYLDDSKLEVKKCRHCGTSHYKEIKIEEANIPE